MNADVQTLMDARNDLNDIERDYASDFDKALRAAVLSIEIAWRIAEDREQSG